MRIAVIGWGSLICCPGSLLLASRWHRDGPRLPIEFARISCDGRLTLVIHHRTPRLTTYWALSGLDRLSDAVRNLRGREKCDRDGVGTLTREGPSPTGYRRQIWRWLGAHPSIEAVIWTELGSNWQKKRGRTFTVSEGVAYLRDLEVHEREAKATLDRARDYMRNAPAQIQTRLRKRMSKDHEWAGNKLSDALFEA